MNTFAHKLGWYQDDKCDLQMEWKQKMLSGSTDTLDPF